MSEAQISLWEVADQDLLKKVWKKNVRPVLRSMKLSDLNLAPDPLHYAGYEWGLQTLVASLANDIVFGRYSPERGEIEPFSSCVCLADLQYVDGLGELSGAPGAAAELAEDVPGLELGVGAFAG